MKKYIHFLLIWLFVLIVLPAAAQVHILTVDGIKLIYKPTAKEVINMRVYFKGGVNNYPLNQAGIDRFALSATVECGTQNYAANAYKDTTDYYGIDMSAEAAYDYADIDVECISKYFDKAWDLLTQAVVNPTFDSIQVDLLKKKLLANIKQSDADPVARATMLAVQANFAGTSYAANPGGTVETISAITLSQLKDYYSSILNKEQIFIVVTGNISKDDLIAKIKASFGKLPRKNYQPADLMESINTGFKVVAEKRDLPINYVYGLLNAPPPGSPNYLAYNFGLSVLNSALYGNLRNRLHLSYSQGCYYQKSQMPFAIIYVNTNRPGEAAPEMMHQLSLLKTTLIPRGILYMLANSYINNYYLQQQSAYAITADLGEAEIYNTWDLQRNLRLRLSEINPYQILDIFNTFVKGICWGYVGDATLEKAMEEHGDFRM